MGTEAMVSFLREEIPGELERNAGQLGCGREEVLMANRMQRATCPDPRGQHQEPCPSYRTALRQGLCSWGTGSGEGDSMW